MKQKLEVICSPYMGYCFGVKRAMSMIEEGIDGTPVYSLGDVIHNPQAVEKLRSKGVRAVSDIDEIPEGSKLVIRAHGVRRDIAEKAQDRGFELIDTTCPFVSRIHEYVTRITEAGRQVVIIGYEGHPEVQGIRGRASGDVIIIQSGEQIPAIPPVEKAGVVIQTTFSRQKALDIIEALKEKIHDLDVYDTICRATTLRIQATLKLASRVDMVLVVGGRGSSNTKRLYEICVEKGFRTRFIEAADEIEESWFEGCRRIGVTTGTSTPEWVIEEVLSRLRGL